METVWLLSRNTGNVTHTAEYHNAKYLKSYRDFSGTMVLSKQRIQNVYKAWGRWCPGSGATKSKYTEFTDEWCRILHHNSFYQYHLQRAEHLYTEWSHQAYTILWRLQPRIHILCGILFTDDGQFTWNGIIDTRNLHSWAQENPHQQTKGHFQL